MRSVIKLLKRARLMVHTGLSRIVVGCLLTVESGADGGPAVKAFPVGAALVPADGLRLAAVESAAELLRAQACRTLGRGDVAAWDGTFGPAVESAPYGNGSNGKAG